MPKGKRMKTTDNSYLKHKKKSNNKFDAFLKIIAFIYIVITIIFYISILKLDLLPGGVVAIFTIAEVIFTLIIIIGLLKKHNTYKLTIFCFIIILFVSGIYLYVTNYALATIGFLGNVFQEVKETEEYYVVVRKESSFNSIEDIVDEEIYLFQAENDVKEKIKQKVDVTFETADNLTNIGNDLLETNIDVILVSASQYSMLCDEIKEFKASTKKIYTEIHELQVSSKVENNNSKYNVENGIFNVYISGIDTTGNISNVSRSDANILATINTNTHEVLLTSIPRDYYVTLHSSQAKDKLTHSGIYGINETVSTVEDLLNIEINYYVRVNFTTVIELVDTLDGIDVYSDYSFTSTNGYYFEKGTNHVNGEEALAFSRERYAFSAGDNQRIKNQQAVIEAIMKKVLNSKTILTKYTSILDSLKGSFQTNLSQDDISNLVKGQLDNMSSWKIKTNSLTGTGASKSTYSMGSQLLYVMIPESTSISEATEKIKQSLGE